MTKSINNLIKGLFISVFIYFCIGVSGCDGGACNCKENYDASFRYLGGDLVRYEGKCYEAQTAGRGILPGPLGQNFNDIWLECAED